MGTRYFARCDGNGSYSIMDQATGEGASYAGRELTDIPPMMLQRGLTIMNGIDEAERTLLRAATVGARPQ